MADKDKPEETTEKKKGLLGGSKVPLDAVLLVVAPFVTFVMLFMYVMGLLPPRPMTVKVVGAAPAEQVPNHTVAARVQPSPAQHLEGSDDLVPGAAIETGAEMTGVLPQAADSMTLDAAAQPGPEPETGESGSDLPAVEAEDLIDDESAAEITEPDPERMERIKQLAKVYEQMNASSVAAIVTNMREDDAVDILSNMKPRNAAKVLASLDPEKAAKLSLRLTE